MQIISNAKTVRSSTVQDLKKFNSQYLTTQVKKRKQIDSMIPAIKKAFNFLGDDIVELTTQNESLKNKMGSYDEKRVQESKANLLKQKDDEKRANLTLCRLKKRMETIK